MDQIEHAVQRIELALGRIATVADDLSVSDRENDGASNMEANAALIAQNQNLQESVDRALSELDELIKEMEA